MTGPSKDSKQEATIAPSHSDLISWLGYSQHPLVDKLAGAPRLQKQHYVPASEIEIGAKCHDVRWLDVAMNDASRMRRGQSRGNLRPIFSNSVEWQPLGSDQIFEGLALNILHHQKVRSRLPRNVVHNIRVIQGRCRL